jgi:hypothetical protein
MRHPHLGPTNLILDLQELNAWKKTDEKENNHFSLPTVEVLIK